MNDGFIKLFRQFVDWEWYDDIPVKVLFLHLLLAVNYKEKRWKGIEIKKGSIVTSIDHLSADTCLTRQQVRTALEKLEKTGEVNKQTTSRYTVIQVNNWNQYQSNNKQITNEQQTDNTPATHQQHTDNKQITTTKERKKERKKEVITSKDEGQKSYGNPEINKTLQYLKKGLMVDDFKETQKMQRQYGRHLVNLGEKIGPQEFRRRFELLLSDDFKKKNCNSIKYIYREIKSTPAESSILSTNNNHFIPTI